MYTVSGKSNCMFIRRPFPVDKEYVGNKLGTKTGSLKDCIDHCDSEPRCQSFNYQKKKKMCYFKDKHLNGSEPLTSWNEAFTVYKVCGEGIIEFFLLVWRNDIVI